MQVVLTVLSELNICVSEIPPIKELKIGWSMSVSSADKARPLGRTCMFIH